MNDMFAKPRLAAAVKFKWQKDEKTYDYWIADGMELAPGDKAIVETKRGETEVEIVEIKDASDKAEKAIIRKVEPPVAAAAPADSMDF
jgi:hypothetical protein